jgi:hypothetical protein
MFNSLFSIRIVPYVVDAGMTRMNATSIHQISLDQYSDARKGDDRFLKCWRIQDCGSCLKSSDHCAWCPIVSLHLLPEPTFSVQRQAA